MKAKAPDKGSREQVASIRSGYLYVLVHPSNSDLYKIGVTVLHPEKRLTQHNRQSEKYAGQIVKETGQVWELRTFVAVPDPYWAEKAFWGATGYSLMPGGVTIEVQEMDWKLVQQGLDAAKKAGVRPQKAVPDWVCAYTTWMNNRLEGRGITLLDRVRSKFGKSNFQCSNGHQWRTMPNNVAEGEGCPQCGLGKKDSKEIEEAIGAGVLCLLTHPEKPGVIRIGSTCSALEQCYADQEWGDWEVHRYRNVDDLVLAESLIWKLLGNPLPHNREPIAIDLETAEKAFRRLAGEMFHEIAIAEKRE